MIPTQSPVVLAFPGNENLAAALTAELQGESGSLVLHQFPDYETNVTVSHAVRGREVVLACTLDRPNEKLVALYLAAETLRDLGARRVVLVAPYLPYMRQDRRFHLGEGVSAAHIAKWLSSFVDGLVTVDPHLHRIHRLEQIYTIPTRVVHAAAPIARWIRDNVTRPVLVGPDEESRQWVSEVAREVSCPHFALSKVRHGDLDVEVRVPEPLACQDHTPVLVDDIVASGRTLLAAIRKLRAAGFGSTVCIGVHALFSGDALEQLQHHGGRHIVTCNTIPHATNAIDLHRCVALATLELLKQWAPIAGKQARA